MGKMQAWTVKDVDGNVLHVGAARSKRAFVQELSLAGKSLAHANLSMLDLSNLDFTGAILDGADLAGADLRGAVLKNASAIKARFVKTRLQGAKAQNTSFDEADMTSAEMSGMRATHSSFRHTRLDGADMSDLDGATCDFTRATADKADLREANLVGCEFTRSTWLQCNFEGANLVHRPFCPNDERSSSLERHMPIRTRGAIVVGCRYDDETKLSHTVPAMQADKRLNRLTDRALWTLSTGSLALGAMKLLDGVSEDALLSHLPTLEGIPHFNAGLGVAGVVMVFSALHVLKDGLIEKARDMMKESLERVVRDTRQMINGMDRHAKHRVHLVVMMARHCSLEPFRRVLEAKSEEARKRGFFGGVRSFFDGLGHVVLCDRRHLALALSALSKERVGTFSPERTVTVVRCDREKSAYGPTAVSFMPDGRARAVWPIAGTQERITVSYDGAGAVSGCVDIAGKSRKLADLDLPDAAGGRLSSVFEFELALLADNGLTGFSYPRDTHYITAGADGSLLVRSLANHNLDNPHYGSPALVRKNGTGILARNGKLRDEWIAEDLNGAVVSNEGRHLEIGPIAFG